MREKDLSKGLDTEIFTFKALEKAWTDARMPHQREHVTPFLYEGGFSILNFVGEEDRSGFRWTLDTSDDFRLIETIYRHLYHGKHDFYMRDVLALHAHFPELSAINGHVEQKA